MRTEKKRGRGRPASEKWSKVGLMWPVNTDTEIARFIGCTPANVAARRKNKIAQAIAEGRKPDSYVCKVKYRRTPKEKVLVNTGQDSPHA